MLYAEYIICRESTNSIQKPTERYMNDISLDPKSFWNFVNTKRKNNGYPARMNLNSKIAENHSEICELFAIFFESVYVDIVMQNTVYHFSCVNQSLKWNH